MTTRKLLAVIATSTALLAWIPAAQAATQYAATRIYLNGADVTNPVHTAAMDPSSHQPTTYMPIYYAEQVLSKLGITSGWDGHTWSLTVPASLTPNLDNPSTGANQMAISINGVTVQTAPKVVALDPASGQQTTFIPIYYLSQVLNRLSVTSTWDGTNWRLTRTTPVTQMSMANTMWTTFTGTTFDVNAHPTMAQVGVNPTSAPVTAGDVATWLADWASKAKGYTAQAYPYTSPAVFVPFSLKYESSTDPYTWASENDLFQGASVTSASSVITPSEVSQITNNLKWWLNGYKVVNGVYHLHTPFYGDYGQWTGEIQGKVLTLQQYQLALADAQHYYDEVTATLSGNDINVTLPNVKGSASEMSWGIVDGSFKWGYGGGPSQTGDYGGTTIKVPSDGAGMVIDTNSFKANNLGYRIAYLNANGSLNFSPYDLGNGQPVK